jgi:hypothetical protein
VGTRRGGATNAVQCRQSADVKRRCIRYTQVPPTRVVDEVTASRPTPANQDDASWIFTLYSLAASSPPAMVIQRSNNRERTAYGNSRECFFESPFPEEPCLLASLHRAASLNSRCCPDRNHFTLPTVAVCLLAPYQATLQTDSHSAAVSAASKRCTRTLITASKPSRSRPIPLSQIPRLQLARPACVRKPP